MNHKLTTNLQSCANATLGARPAPASSSQLPQKSVRPGLFRPTIRTTGWEMEKDKHALLCIWCKRRITAEELRSGRHDHVDVEERCEYDSAVNNGID